MGFKSEKMSFKRHLHLHFCSHQWFQSRPPPYCARCCTRKAQSSSHSMWTTSVLHKIGGAPLWPSSHDRVASEMRHSWKHPLRLLSCPIPITRRSSTPKSPSLLPALPLLPGSVAAAMPTPLPRFSVFSALLQSLGPCPINVPAKPLQRVTYTEACEWAFPLSQHSCSLSSKWKCSCFSDPKVSGSVSIDKLSRDVLTLTV